MVAMDKVYIPHVLQLHGGFRVRLRLVLGFYSVRHLMNGWDLKYTFSVAIFSKMGPCVWHLVVCKPSLPLYGVVL